MNNALNEINEAQGIPKINKQKNEKLFKKESDFLKRMEQDQIRLEKKKQKLEQQYYNNKFKPAINRNKKVSAQVFKNEMYANL